jgi:3-isopropylmalate/(R)-2-methylmalate dehydratase small subunit
VVAKSFARIYYRNAINSGLLLLTCPAAVDAAQARDSLEIDLTENRIYLNGQVYPFPPLSPTALSILEAGGLVPYLHKKLGIKGEVQAGSMQE